MNKKLLVKFLNGVIQLLLSVFGVLVIVVLFPFWLVGKLSSRQRVQLGVCPKCGGLGAYGGKFGYVRCDDCDGALTRKE